ncbi:MAG: hypothetical protein L6Q99_12110 [Planctomycetes bacterium]|nr:hypothetical protein [Planctomycetota bacterium]
MNDSVAAETLVHVFHAGVEHELVRATTATLSRFGGPLELPVTGATFGPRRLHAIAHVSGAQVPTLLGARASLELDLAFGLCFDDCRLEYEHDADRLRVLSITPPTSSDDWPYADYPALLPFAPLELASSSRREWREFATRHGLGPDGPALEPPAELVVVVPPPMTLGVSLWGRMGDLEGVRVVFECALEPRRVRAYTVAT